MPLTPYAYKMRVKLKEEGIRCLSLPTPCWHINEKTRPLAGVDIQKHVCPKSITIKKNLSHESWLLLQPHQKEQSMTPNQFKWGWQWQRLPMCKHHQLSTQCQFVNVKTIRGGGRTWVCFRETWNPTFLIMVTKRIHTTSCEAIFSPPCTQWKRWIPIGSKAWLQM